MRQKGPRRDRKFSQTRSRNLMVQFVRLKTGKSIRQLADEMGKGYHSLIKTLWRHPGRLKHRAAIAEALGIPYDDLWGPGSEAKLKKLVKAEIDKASQEHALRFKKTMIKKMVNG